MTTQKRHLLTILFGLCLLTAGAQSSYEPFDYPADDLLDGQGAIEPGWSGFWSLMQGDEPFIEAGSIDTDLVPVQGNKAVLDFQSGGVRIDRPLYETYEDDGYGVWVSFVLDLTGATVNNNVGQLILMKDGEQVLAMGREYGNNKLGFFFWPNVFQYDTDIASDTVHWIVALIEMSGSPDEERAFLWVDPDPTRMPLRSQADVQIPRGNLPKFYMNDGFNGVRLKAEGTPPLRMEIDEVRIGRSFEHVSPYYEDMSGEESSLIAFEPFDYEAGSPLHGAGDAEGLWGAPWLRTAGDEVFIENGSLLYEGLEGEVSGNQAHLDFQSSGIRYDRPLATYVDDDGRTVWMSFLLDLGDSEQNNNVGQVILMNGSNQVFAVGRHFGTNRFGFFWWPNVFQYTTVIPTNGLHWLVTRIDFSGGTGGEAAWLWVDPDPFLEPDTALADLKVPQEGLPPLAMDLGFDGVRLKAEGTPPLSMRVDELRIGRGFSDVSPAEPTSLATPARFREVRLFPNPVRETLQVRYALEQSAAVTLRLLDVNGRELDVRRTGPQPAGPQRLDWDARALPPGIYFLQMTDGTHLQTFKFSKQ